MTARLLMTPAQVAAEPDWWMERRRRTPEDGRWCVTASEIPLVCGIAPPAWGGPYKLYHAKLSGQELVTDTDEMRRGRALEPLVLDDFRDMYPGLVVLPGGLYCHGEDDRWLATFDAQIVAADTLAAQAPPLQPAHGGALLTQLARLGLEREIFPGQVKTSIPTEGYGWAEDSDEVPDHIRAQVLWEMFVRGATLGFVIVKFMLTWRTKVYQIEMDDQARAEVAWMLDQAEAFSKRLTALDEPPVDWFPATTATLRNRFGEADGSTARVPWRLALRYKAALRAAAELKERRGLVTNQLLERAGNASTIEAREWVTGRIIKVATRTVTEAQPPHMTKGTKQTTRLNACGWAKDHGDTP